LQWSIEGTGEGAPHPLRGVNVPFYHSKIQVQEKKLNIESVLI
jgi:hypothetical protein